MALYIDDNDNNKTFVGQKSLVIVLLVVQNLIDIVFTDTSKTPRSSRHVCTEGTLLRYSLSITDYSSPLNFLCRHWSKLITCYDHVRALFFIYFLFIYLFIYLYTVKNSLGTINSKKCLKILKSKILIQYYYNNLQH